MKPARLKPGDVVGVISPSTPVVSKKDLSRGLRVLESLGFKPKLTGMDGLKAGLSRSIEWFSNPANRAHYHDIRRYTI